MFNLAVEFDFEAGEPEKIGEKPAKMNNQTQF